MKVVSSIILLLGTASVAIAANDFNNIHRDVSTLINNESNHDVVRHLAKSYKKGNASGASRSSSKANKSKGTGKSSSSSSSSTHPFFFFAKSSKSKTGKSSSSKRTNSSSDDGNHDVRWYWPVPRSSSIDAPHPPTPSSSIDVYPPP